LLHLILMCSLGTGSCSFGAVSQHSSPRPLQHRKLVFSVTT
jgi:hypothetical protein